MTPTSPISGDRAALYGQHANQPETREEVAQRFEEVFVRQFVKEFTDEMFSSSLTEDGGGAALQGQKRMQRDQMTELLTDRLTDDDALDFDRQLLRHWKVRYGTERDPS